jgi:hypothetical protein
MYTNDIDRAARRLETFFKLKRNSPEFFRNRNVHGEGIQNSMKNQYYLMLPRLSEKMSLAYHGLKSSNPSDYYLDEAIKMMIMTSGRLFTKKSSMKHFRNELLFGLQRH